MSGLTRIELLILLLIGGICTGIVLPAIEQAREAARRDSCKNNLKQVGLALANYHEVFESFPYGCVGNPKFDPSQRWSWYLGLIPLLEQAPMVPFDPMKASDDRRNVPLTFKAQNKEGKVTEYRLVSPLGITCPNGETETDPLGQSLATYVGMAGIGRAAPTLPLADPRAGMWGFDRMTTSKDVSQTKDSTIHVIESAVGRGSWYRGGQATLRGFVPGGKTAIGNTGQFGGFHPRVAMTLFADGQMRALSEDTDPKMFASMATVADDR